MHAPTLIRKLWSWWVHLLSFSSNDWGSHDGFKNIFADRNRHVIGVCRLQTTLNVAQSDMHHVFLEWLKVWLKTTVQLYAYYHSNSTVGVSQKKIPQLAFLINWKLNLPNQYQTEVTKPVNYSTMTLFGFNYKLKKQKWLMLTHINK